MNLRTEALGVVILAIVVGLSGVPAQAAKPHDPPVLFPMY